MGGKRSVSNVNKHNMLD